MLASFFGNAEIPLGGNIEALALQIVRFSHARTGSDHRLARTGKPANIVTTAIARELSGFVWAIARQVAVTTD
jgi:hypothetical protein